MARKYKLKGGSTVFDEFVKKLEFKTALKKVIKYQRVSSIDDTTKKSFYIHTGEVTEVVTSINKQVETKNTCNPGDFVITGPKGEKYVIPPHKLPNNYNLLNNVLVTRQQPRLVVEVTKELLDAHNLPEHIEFTASWGEQMILKAGDYLVKEDEGKYYRIERSTFKQTYRFTK